MPLLSFVTRAIHRIEKNDTKLSDLNSVDNSVDVYNLSVEPLTTLEWLVVFNVPLKK